MAASDPVAASRAVFLEGDVAYRRAVSEGLLSKSAAQNNFINTYQTDIKEFKLNGEYKLAVGITFFDGAASFFFNTEVVGAFIYNGVAGTSGPTEFDIIWKNAAGATQGSIFSTTPKISAAASNETIGFRNLTTTTDISPTGVTLPVFSKTSFLEGESIFMKLNSAMVDAQNCGITIFYKPIN